MKPREMSWVGVNLTSLASTVEVGASFHCCVVQAMNENDLKN